MPSDGVPWANPHPAVTSHGHGAMPTMCSASHQTSTQTSVRNQAMRHTDTHQTAVSTPVMLPTHAHGTAGNSCAWTWDMGTAISNTWTLHSPHGCMRVAARDAASMYRSPYVHGTAYGRSTSAPPHVYVLPAERRVAWACVSHAALRLPWVVAPHLDRGARLGSGSLSRGSWSLGIRKTTRLGGGSGSSGSGGA